MPHIAPHRFAARLRLGRLAVCLGFCALSAAACVTTTPPPPPGGGIDTRPDPLKPPTDQGGDTPAKGAGWDCSGNLVPPTGWEQETAYEDLSSTNADQRAIDKARSKLLRRLCGGSDCAYLNARTTAWKTGRDASRACAMVVIEGRDLDQWRDLQKAVAKLDGELDAVVDQLVGKARRKPFVAVDKIMDSGAPGGPRAIWLRKRFEGAATRKQLNLTEIPKGWKGDGLPRGVDLLIRATAVRRKQNQRPVVEVTWEGWMLTRGRKVKRVSKPVIFPEDAAPIVADAFDPLPPSTGPVSVRLDAGKGGSLCLGEKTQIWLRAEENMHVRVFDLYGKDGALLLFPNASQPSGEIRRGQTLPLGGPEGFDALPAPGKQGERFLVIAAAKASDLGPFEQLTDYCRLPPKVASALHQGRGLPPNVHIASDGFRIVQDATCPPPPDASVIDKIAENLAALPECALP